MKAKDKANDLIEMYLNIISDTNPLDKYLESAKECALICVDELSNCDWYIPSLEEHKKWKKYWKEVKKQIKNLK